MSSLPLVVRVIRATRLRAPLPRPRGPRQEPPDPAHHPDLEGGVQHRHRGRDQRLSTGGLEVAEAGDVADGERMCCVADAGDLGADVAGATDQNVVVQARQRGG